MPAEHETRRKTELALWAAGVAIALLICIGLVTVGPLRGCISRDPTAANSEKEKKKREAEKKKPDYEVDDPVIQPGERPLGDQMVKPGHWTTATQRMRANYRDFIGQSLLIVVNKQNDAYPVDRTPFMLRSTRPVALSKGRPKNIETTLLVPQVSSEVKLATDLVERGLGATIRRPPTKLTRMPSYQYYFVVLAKEPSRYALLKTLDSVRVPFGGESEFDLPEDALHYRVVEPDVSQSIPLADNPLTWTGIAYILWDEVAPQLFTPAQARALVDWLHWGGQLVINGPDSLDLVKGSFLEPYLPATSTGTQLIGAQQLAELNEGWTVSTRRMPGEPLAPLAPWSGIGLKLHPDARPLWSTGGLLVERSIGRGRIVVSAMQLSERELVNWRSGFESLFNACVLRRPTRVYQQGSGGVTLAWADKALKDRRLDARLTTRLRYFARDEGVATSYRWMQVADNVANQPVYNPYPSQPIPEYQPPEHAGGIGAWNDFSATADAARAALVEAAGVEVPGARFVVTCLVAYLIALVPLNWFIFHTLGRVEWAWLAAPVIAVTGTFVVVDRARLDIGFVRAQTEIGLLELQPAGTRLGGSPRGHLARYTSLYTSLSTTYDLESENLTTLAAPFPVNPEFQPLAGQGWETVDFQRYDNVRLTGLNVASNSANMLHSEQMFTLDGPIRLGKSSVRGRDQIENHSQLHLRSVGVVRRPAAGEHVPPGAKLMGMWIGELRPAESAPLGYLPLSFDQGTAPFAEERLAEARRQGGGQWLDLEALFRLAYDPERIEPGDVRLVARVDGVLPGETIAPAASQVRGAVLVLAHLRYAPLADAQPDRNTKQDVSIGDE